jgi:hypothetical protein
MQYSELVWVILTHLGTAKRRIGATPNNRRLSSRRQNFLNNNFLFYICYQLRYIFMLISTWQSTSLQPKLKFSVFFLSWKKCVSWTRKNGFRERVRSGVANYQLFLFALPIIYFKNICIFLCDLYICVRFALCVWPLCFSLHWSSCVLCVNFTQMCRLLKNFYFIIFIQYFVECRR